MAGIGGYAPVINLPRDERWSELGEGLGKFAGSLYDSWNQADTMKKAANIPDISQRMLYVQSRMGEKGGKFVEQQMKLLESQQSIEASKATVAERYAQIHSAEILDRLHTVQANDQAALDAARIRSENASAAAAAASAAGSGARAALEMSEKRKIDQEIEQLKARQEAAGRSHDLILKLLQNSQGGDGSGSPSLQPQSYEQPQGESVPAPIRPISTTDIQAPVIQTAGPTSPTESSVVKPGETPTTEGTSGIQTKKILDLQGSLLAGKDLGAGQRIPYSPKLLGEVQSYLDEGTPEGNAKAFAALQKGDQPTGATRMVEIVPGSGIKVEVGRYSDGKEYIVPNSKPELDLKPINEVGKRAGEGAILWQGTSQVLKMLGNTTDPNAKAGDVFGTRLMRSTNDWLVKHHFNPIGENASAVSAFETMIEHSLVGIQGLSAGLRGTNEVRAQFRAMMPTLSDPVELRNTKIRATELTADLMIKEEVEAAIANKETVDPGLRELYLSKRLWQKDITQLRDEYVASVTAAGQKPVEIKAKRSGEPDTAETISQPPATKSTSTPPPSSRGSDSSGWTITRHPD